MSWRLWTQLLLHTAKIRFFAWTLASCNSGPVHKRQDITSTYSLDPPSGILAITCRDRIRYMAQLGRAEFGGHVFVMLLPYPAKPIIA